MKKYVKLLNAVGGRGTLSRENGCQEIIRHAELDSGSINADSINPHPSFGHPLPEVEGILLTNLLTFKKFGFTLAETLITLAIIGVVAALTLPSLISSYKERATVVRVKQSYSLLSQAVAKMIAEHGTLDVWADDSVEFFEQELNKHLNVIEEEKCVYPYTDCSYSYLLSNKRYILSNGMVISTQSRSLNTNTPGLAVFGCTGSADNPTYFGPCAFVNVDINGKQKPNIIGKDAFRFIVYKDGVVPMGLSEKRIHSQYSFKFCNETGGNCTAWVIYNENMDYLRCRDKLSFEGAHSCKEAGK